MDSLILAGGQPYDLIFCRNLLIYLHAAARVQVRDNLIRFLASDGLLCMGHAEPIQLQDARFELVPPERFMLFRLASVSRPYAPEESRAQSALKAQVAEPKPSVAGVPRRPAAVDEDALTRALRLADTGELDAALAACTTHLDRAVPSADAYALLGILRQARHEKDEAMRCFEKALYLQPDHAEALTHLMLLWEQLGHTDRAANLRRRLERARSGDQL